MARFFQSPMLWLLIPLATIALAFLWGEAIQWRSSRRRLGNQPRPGGREVVVVLGYQNPGRINRMNKHRVRCGLRSIDPGAAETTVLMCGGAVTGPIAEATLLERYAREVLGYTGAIALDTRSYTTWENIENAIPHLEDADVIKIVSLPIHGEKARAHLAFLRPDLAARVVRGKDYRFGEIPIAKFVGAIIGLRHLREIREHRPKRFRGLKRPGSKTARAATGHN